MVVVGMLSSAHALEIGEGTWELGGRATANIVIDGDSDVFLDLSPTLGYFVGRDLELLGGISMYVDDNVLGVGFFGGLDYFLGSDSAQPYIGGTIGYGNDLFGLGPTYDLLPGEVVTIAGRFGLALPLTRKTALDLGGRLNFNIADGSTWIHIPLGYLGIRAFF
jgi:hypothetical protein